MPSRELPWLHRDIVASVADVAHDQGVSARALSPGQFFEQYMKVRGDFHRLPPYWRNKRNAFVARHRKQLLDFDFYGSGWDDQGNPTPRHIALAVWAWSPGPGRLERWLKREGWL